MIEERIYARWLGAIVTVAFAGLVASFFIYLFRLLPPGIPPEDLPRYWALPVADYVKATGAPTGWAWIRRLNEGDLLNFAGVAVMGSATILAYLRVMPVLAVTGRRALALIALAQVVVLAVAASGLAFSTH